MLTPVVIEVPSRRTAPAPSTPICPGGRRIVAAFVMEPLSAPSAAARRRLACSPALMLIGWRSGQ
jgi:hypothetical protein